MRSTWLLVLALVLVGRAAQAQDLSSWQGTWRSHPNWTRFVEVVVRGDTVQVFRGRGQFAQIDNLTADARTISFSSSWSENTTVRTGDRTIVRLGKDHARIKFTNRHNEYWDSSQIWRKTDP